ncbi:MAG: hypothetical protein GX608_12715 [Lentisphaerae bacterium]|nr:hypothetical protein [Lentisphaerota bacterium]
MMRVILLLSGLFAVFSAAAEDLNSWQKRMPISFSGFPADDGKLTNFPALVILSNTAAGVGFNYTDFLSPPWGDLRFAAADKTTPLDFEVEAWNPGGLSYVWVRIPELTNNTVIHALWGKGGVVAPPCATNGAVWTDEFRGVWHLNGNTLDATSNKYHGVNYGATVSAGIAAGGHGLNGTSAYIDLPANLRGLGASGAFSIFCWFQQDAVDNGTLLEDGTSWTSDSIYLGLSSANQMFVRLNTVTKPSGVYSDTVPVGTIGTNWRAVAYVYDGASATLYLDAVQVWSAAISGTIYNGNTHMQMGRRPQGTGSFLRGLMDEVRIQNVSHSLNWIRACFINMASNSVFNSYGAPEYGGGPVVTNLGAVSEIDFMTLNGYLLSTGMDANVSAAVFWGTNDAGPIAEGWTYTNRMPGIAAEGPLSVNVTPDKVGALYYFRFFASNSFSQGWASPAHGFIWWADVRTGSVFSTW